MVKTTDQLLEDVSFSDDLSLYTQCKEYLSKRGFEKVDPNTNIWAIPIKGNTFQIELYVTYIENDHIAIMFDCPQLNKLPLCVEDIKQFKTFVRGIKYINKTYRVHFLIESKENILKKLLKLMLF